MVLVAHRLNLKPQTTGQILCDLRQLYTVPSKHGPNTEVLPLSLTSECCKHQSAGLSIAFNSYAFVQWNPLVPWKNGRPFLRMTDLLSLWEKVIFNQSTNHNLPVVSDSGEMGKSSSV